MALPGGKVIGHRQVRQGASNGSELGNIGLLRAMLNNHKPTDLKRNQSWGGARYEIFFHDNCTIGTHSRKYTIIISILHMHILIIY
jgi:hypothetical protein